MTTGHNPSNSHVSSVDLGDADLNERVSAGMDEVEELLRGELASGEDFVRDKVLHLAEAGGKRFRPMMALLASEFGESPGCESVIKAGTIVEMVHLATLYHDDVMDEADRRRGVESANQRWNNSVAILAGDILLAHASRIMGQLDTRTITHFAETFEELATGQMREALGHQGQAGAVEHYMQVIEEKTGVLIASACYLGALHSGASEEHIDALYKLGGIIGVVFQIVDDIIDIYSAPDDSGKTPGTDLREGVFTLPVLLAMEEDSDAGRELSVMLTGPLTEEKDVERALQLLEESNGRARTLDVVREYLGRADEQFDRLPQIPATDALRRLGEFTISRVG